VALWAPIVRNSSEKATPTYASMAGKDPASGKDWKSKPKQQVEAWNQSMQHTYHTYIPGSYQSFPSKVAEIRTSAASSGKEQSFKDYSSSYGSLGRMAIQKAKDRQGRSPRSGAASEDGPDFHSFAPGDGGQGGSPSSSFKKYFGDFKQTAADKYLPNLEHSETSDFLPDSPGPVVGRPATEAGADAGESRLDLGAYMHRSGWKQQLGGVIPSFVPGEFSAAQQNGRTEVSGFLAKRGREELQQDVQMQWLLPVLMFVSLAAATFAASYASSRRTIAPPEHLLG